MSVAVELDGLKAEVKRYGDRPYLLTVGADGRPHAVAVRARFDGDELVVGAGRKTAANAGERPAVTLLWPALEPGGFSLIADGEADVVGDQIRIRPSSAVLHRTLAEKESGPDDGPGAAGEGDHRTSECVGVFRH